MDMNKATVTLRLEDVDNMRKQIAALEAELSDAQKHVEAARMGEPGSDVNLLVLAVQSALPVVQFAVGHLDPLTVRGWPYEQLHAFAKLLPALPGIDPAVAECWADLARFADHAKSWERTRERGDEQERLAAETAARGGTLTIPEAS